MAWIDFFRLLSDCCTQTYSPWPKTENETRKSSIFAYWASFLQVSSTSTSTACEVTRSPIRCPYIPCPMTTLLSAEQHVKDAEPKGTKNCQNPSNHNLGNKPIPFPPFRFDEVSHSVGILKQKACSWVSWALLWRGKHWETENHQKSPVTTDSHRPARSI